MDEILKSIPNLDNNSKSEENLFVKNIIVNKEKSTNSIIPYIATEKWVKQLGNRAEFNY